MASGNAAIAGAATGAGWRAGTASAGGEGWTNQAHTNGHQAGTGDKAGPACQLGETAKSLLKKTEDRSQKTEERREKTGDRSQKTEVPPRRTFGRSQESE